ncbi:hypothetical protein TSAR_001618 [Trichomalopsis sarcophagae]|uniref:Uncharacterized protein n=1 Tax=Trichomalopsis sarcophagae TaxID=543379 RepID=A0A232FA43_9HYME|nr:hypothetical protein TSAR_001618 [Trichomalopsis sarcophagae]
MASKSEKQSSKTNIIKSSYSTPRDSLYKRPHIVEKQIRRKQEREKNRNRTNIDAPKQKLLNLANLRCEIPYK